MQSTHVFTIIQGVIMRRLALCLAALMLIPLTFACSDDDNDNDKGKCTGSSCNSDIQDGKTDAKYDVSAENACNYLVANGGTNTIEMDFDPETASEEAITKAKTLCAEELNGLPNCKDAFIAEYSCEYAVNLKKLSDAAYLEAIGKCDEDKNCFDEAMKLYPCYDVIAAEDKCVHDLSDDDQDALSNYTEDYRLKYSE